VKIFHYHYFPDSDSLLSLLSTLTAKVNHMSAQLDSLTAEVAENATVVGSAITLLNGLKAQLDAALASSDPVEAIQALADSLDTTTNNLAAAVAANTPAGP